MVLPACLRRCFGAATTIASYLAPCRNAAKLTPSAWQQGSAWAVDPPYPGGPNKDCYGCYGGIYSPGSDQSDG